MKTQNAFTTSVVLLAALLCAAVPVMAQIGMTGALDNVFTVVSEKGTPVGTVAIDGVWSDGGAHDTYAMEMATGALPCPAGNGLVELAFSLTVVDPAIDKRSEKQWGVEFFRLNQDGRFVPIDKKDDGHYRFTTNLSGMPPGLVRIPVYYRFRAGREQSGFRLLGLKFTTGAKTGTGSGASGICLYVVKPPQGLFDDCGRCDRDAVFAWAKSLRNIAVGGDERVAVGGIYPLFTPRSVNTPDPAAVAAVQGQIDAVTVKAQAEIDRLTKAFGEQAESIKAQYKGQIDAVTADAAKAKGDLAATQATLATANGILAQLRAGTEQRVADQHQLRLEIPQPADGEDGGNVPPPVPTAERPGLWASATYVERDGRRIGLVVTALTNGVVIETSYNRNCQVAPVTLTKGNQWTIWFVSRKGVYFGETRVTLRCGDDKLTYGTRGQIGGGQ